MSKTVENFSIVRSPVAITARIISVIALGDILFVLSIFVLLIARNLLNIDATFVLLYFIIFVVQALIVIFAVYKDLMSWTKNQYYVSDGFFVANKKLGHGGAKNIIVPLKYIRKVSSKQTSFQKKFGYGTLDIRFTENNFEEKIVIKDVVNPQYIMKMLRQSRSN